MFSDITFGIIGAGLVLFAFVMNQTGRWKANNFFYDLVNFAGSAMLVAYAFFTQAYPFLLLNLVWAGVSFKDILKDISGKE